jgi:RNA polymerase sigma-70 factor, ECF subfamily
MEQHEFRALFDAHLAFVWRVLARHGLPERELEDGCQEVFLVVYRRLSEFEQRSSFRTWLYGVTVRVALGMRRRSRRRERLEQPALEPPSTPQPFEALYSRQLHQQLTAAMASLPRAKREVFVLYELEDMTIAEAAAALGIAENTALYRLYAAREAIAAFVRKAERSSELAGQRRRSKTEVA